MPMPEQLVIFGRTYDITDVSPFQISEGVLGQASYRDGVIYLDEDLDLSLSLSALWREAVHIAQQEIDGRVDETQARWISLFVHNLLVQNPDLVRCYVKGLGLDRDDTPDLSEDDRPQSPRFDA